LDQLVVVTHRFHIKPLLPWLSGNGHFFVLTLSRKEVRLLQGTRYSICELELQGVPQGIAEQTSSRIHGSSSFLVNTRRWLS
jgi:Bacterial archaeo-eukaryotic release factor family 3